jgi:hypothetical protein
MTIIPSRLLTRLDADIAAATDPVAADCLRAERAAYLARQGHFELAAEAIEAIRQRHSARPNAAVSAWVSLAEGLLIHFTDMNPQARDKVQRAYALSTAADLRPIRAISAAWLAHLEYLALDVDRYLDHAHLALSLSGDGNLSARFRSCLVIGMTFHLAAKYELALPWYEKARNSAIALGDNSALSALMHNVAWLRAFNLKHSLAQGAVDGKHVRQVLLSADSSSRFDILIGTASLKSLHPLLWAFVSSMQGNFSEALIGYRDNISTGVAEGIRGMGPVLLADLAWCMVQSGDIDEGLRIAFDIYSSAGMEGHPDNRAMIYGRLADTFKIAAMDEEFSISQGLATQAWSQHESYQQKLIQRLCDLGFYP